MNNNRHSYFLCGVGAGIAAGLLWAPRPGTKTRAMLIRSAKESGELAARTTKEISDALAGTVKRTRNAVQKTTAGVIDAFEERKAALLG